MSPGANRAVGCGLAALLTRVSVRPLPARINTFVRVALTVRPEGSTAESVPFAAAPTPPTVHPANVVAVRVVQLVTLTVPRVDVMDIVAGARNFGSRAP